MKCQSLHTNSFFYRTTLTQTIKLLDILLLLRNAPAFSDCSVAVACDIGGHLYIKCCFRFVLFCFGFVFLTGIGYHLYIKCCFFVFVLFFFNRDYGKGSSEKLFSSTVSSQAVDSAGSSKVSSKQETVTTTASAVTASPAPKLTIKSEPLERTVVSQTLSTTFVHVSKLGMSHSFINIHNGNYEGLHTQGAELLSLTVFPLYVITFKVY